MSPTNKFKIIDQPIRAKVVLITDKTLVKGQVCANSILNPGYSPRKIVGERKKYKGKLLTLESIEIEKVALTKYCVILK